MRSYWLILMMFVIGGCFIHRSPEVVIPGTNSPFVVWGIAPEEMASTGMDIVYAEARLDGQRQIAENIASFLRSRTKLYFEGQKVFQDPAGAQRFLKSITVNLVALHFTGISNGDLIHDKKHRLYRMLIQIDPENLGEISKPLMNRLFHANSEYLDKKSEEEIQRLNEDISKFFLDEATRAQHE